ncbi:MAG: hypothetical protein RLZZ172_2540 [Bacteroidota bacterium]|jgi:uncharacterized membrane protein
MQPFLLLSTEPLQTGLLHPLIVHFPIGIVYFMLLLSLMPQTLRNSLKPAISIALLTASVSAILASITGYLLSRSGDYDTTAIVQHQWSGIITGIFLLISCFIKKFQRQLIWISALSLTVTGHWGGELTHGSGYLNKIFGAATTDLVQEETGIQSSADTTVTLSPTANKTQKYSPYQTTIAPILKANCYSCHSSLKKKGGLRLDNEQWIKAGGKNGLILVHGNPGKSTIYTHLKLPLEDEKHMPPKGKKQLNTGDINTIFQWIQMGAPFGEITRNIEKTIVQNTEVAMVSVQETDQENNKHPMALKYQPLPVADSGLIQSLINLEAIVRNDPNRINGLYINLVNIKKITPEIIQNLSGLKEQVIALKLNEIKLESNELQFLSDLRQLTSLQLSGTSLTDAGLMPIKDLPELRHLNLYGTQVTDQSLDLIGRLKNIRTVTLWNTHMTDSALRQFSKQHPEIMLEFGALRLNKTDSLQKQ